MVYMQKRLTIAFQKSPLDAQNPYGTKKWKSMLVPKTNPKKTKIIQKLIYDVRKKYKKKQCWF